MDLTARIEAIDAASCNLIGTSEVSMSGKAATFGGRMMGSVADQVLKQFAGNFATQVQAMQARQPPPPSGPSEPSAATTTATAPRVVPAAAPTQLNGLALAWAVIIDWLRGLFGARKA